ncbi:MAG: molecular chaperone [Pseudomonadota bacterium]
MRLLLCSQCLMVILACSPLLARAELMLNPTRVVLANHQRAAQVELINNGKEPATYRISLVNRRMSETGEFSNADTPAEGEQFATDMLSYSPRQITLLPGTAQVVRVMVRKPDGLAEGEYRSHLHFEKLADAAGATSVEGATAPGAQIGVVLKALVGASIPVIVRHGAPKASVALADVRLQPGTGASAPLLQFTIQRSGNSSVYGDVIATLMPVGGQAQPLARASGVAIYLPNALRRAALSLQLPSGQSLARGQLHLAYRERPEAGGKLLAEAFLNLP